MAMKPMRLEGILKLYAVLYSFACLLTFLVSIPMLWHVLPKSECLLFVTPRIEYGEPAACNIVGFLPLLVAVAAIGLMTFQILQLRNLKAHLRNPEVSSIEYRENFKKQFWKMLIFHSVITVVVLTVACLVTSGYATSCLNLSEHVRNQIRGRIVNTRTQLQSTNQAHETFDTDNQINRYTNNQYNSFGQNKYEESITCRLLLTDRENYLTLLKNHAGNSFYEQFYGTLWKQERTDQGSLKDKASKFNLVLELSMAGSWMSLLLWLVMIGLMVKAKHHLKAPITDESMWGGSEFGGSMKSGKSGRRTSQMMSPPPALDYTFGNDFDRMSDRGSRISYDRGSRMSRGSRGSKGTSYKDMGNASKNPKGSNSYKSMNGSKKTSTKANPQVAQLTVSMVEKAPIAKAYPLQKYLTENASLHSLDMSVADTIHGTTFGPTANLMAPHPTPKTNGVASAPGGGGSLLDYFSSPQPVVQQSGGNKLPEPNFTSLESGIM